MPISRIAFLDILEFNSGESYRGAVLLTQEQTVPIEFYLTDPLRPNPLQKLLYGAIFEEYLKFEVFGKPLLSNLSSKPEIVFVRETALLNLVDTSEIPLALMTPENSLKSLVCGKNYEDKILRKEIEGLVQKHNFYEPFERIISAVTQIHEQQQNGKK